MNLCLATIFLLSPWHQLRHTFATELVQKQIEIYNISQILGHSDVRTTSIYLSVNPERIRSQMNGANLFSEVFVM